MDTKLYSEMYRQEKSYWWHVAKRKLVQSYVSGKKVLDVGCGTGAMLSELKEKGFEIYGLDGSEEALKFCRQRGLENLKLADFEKKLPYPDSTFDTVLCLDVAEHVANDSALVRELKRVLKTGGRLIITVPAYRFLWTYWDQMLGHKRRYNLPQVKKLIKQSRLEIEKASYFFCLHSPAFVVRFIKNKLGGKSSDFVEVSGPVNKFLLFASAIERFLLHSLNLPFGISILLVSRKNEN